MRCSRPLDVGVPAVRERQRGAQGGQAERSTLMRPDPLHWLILTPILAQVFPLNIHGCVFKGKAKLHQIYVHWNVLKKKKTHNTQSVQSSVTLGLSNTEKKKCSWAKTFLDLFHAARFLFVSPVFTAIVDVHLQWHERSDKII